MTYDGAETGAESVQELEGLLVERTDYRALALDLAVTLACSGGVSAPGGMDAVGVTRVAEVLLDWLEAGDADE